MSHIKISIVLPVYNAEKYLSEALESILNQTFSKFELIIIDDGSLDNSLQIMTHYAKNDSRIKIISRSNKGLIASLNEGISQSKGKYIARMDADDISLPTRLQEQFYIMEQQNSDICGCHFHIIDESGKIIDNFIAPLTDESVLLYLTQTVPFAHGSVLFRREFLEKHQLSYGQTDFSSIEDYALWIKFYEFGAKFTNVNQILFKYRQYAFSFSSTKTTIMHTETQQLSTQFIEKYIFEIHKGIGSLCDKSLSVQEKNIMAILATKHYRKIKPLFNQIVKKTGKKIILFKIIDLIVEKIG